MHSVLAISMALAALSSPCFDDPTLARTLRALDERLLVAVHRGDRATWEGLTTPDFAYVEEGVVQLRQQFLAGLQEDHLEPLVIRDYTACGSGDTAIVLHHDTVPGISSFDGTVALYLMTETWQRLGSNGSDWKLRIVHIEAVRADPPHIALIPGQIDELAGTYTRGATRVTIRRNGSHILEKRNGSAERELLAETRDSLFVAGDPRVRWIFLRDQEGRVAAMAERYENLEIIYQRQH
ncbi:MAG: nuclear transport factor 2 family protein [Steroidobacteraceae bacterium]